MNACCALSCKEVIAIGKGAELRHRGGDGQGKVFPPPHPSSAYSQDKLREKWLTSEVNIKRNTYSVGVSPLLNYLPSKHSNLTSLVIDLRCEYDIGQNTCYFLTPITDDDFF